MSGVSEQIELAQAAAGRALAGKAHARAGSDFQPDRIRKRKIAKFVRTNYWKEESSSRIKDLDLASISLFATPYSPNFKSRRANY
jgi:hypothetical protein